MQCNNRPMGKPHSDDVNLLFTAVAGAVAMAAAMGFGRFSFTPILPGMISGLPLSAGDAGLIAAGNFCGYLAGAVLSAYGWAAGRERLIALSSLLATSVLLAAMALSSNVVAFIAIRFLAGVASAFIMVFISSVVLGYAAARGNDHVPSAHFGGVGLGIATSSLMVALIAAWAQQGVQAWRIDWLVGALLTFLMLLVVWALLPVAPPQAARPVIEPKLVWRRPLVLVTVSYGLFGFGYVITATFIVAMARMGQAGQTIEFLTWFLTGCTAAVSIFVWRPVMLKVGLAGVYVAGLLVEAAGVLASVMLPLPAAPLVGGVLLGGTFIMVTAYGLRIGRHLSPESPRRALAFMTAAFGIGQIAGPLVAGAVAERTGSFALPSVLAAAALVLSVLLVLPVYRRIP